MKSSNKNCLFVNLRGRAEILVVALIIIIPIAHSMIQLQTPPLPMKFSVVPATPNPKNKFNQRLMDQILPQDLGVTDAQLLQGGGRIVFTSTFPSSVGLVVLPHQQKETDKIMWKRWTKCLSPASIKSLRVILTTIALTRMSTDEEIVQKLEQGCSKVLPWDLYQAFGNGPQNSKRNHQKRPSSRLDISCRHWASSCIPRGQISTTNIANQLRKLIIKRWGSHPWATVTDCEFTLLIFEDKCWLEWTLLVPPSASATMDLPHPGCKRVEAWMLVQASCGNLFSRQSMKQEKPLVIMDPLCGKGTYLVEAATTLDLPRIVSFIGVDLSAEQLEDARANAERTGVQDIIQWRQADSRIMDWQPDDSVDVILTCPPFGIQFGRDEILELPRLYKEWVQEFARVLRPNHGYLALLVDTDNQEAAIEAIKETKKLEVIVHREPFRLGRLQATVIVAESSSTMGSADTNKEIAEAANSPFPGKSPLRRFEWESNARESRAEWARLRAAALQELVPLTARQQRSG